MTDNEDEDEDEDDNHAHVPRLLGADFFGKPRRVVPALPFQLITMSRYRASLLELTLFGTCSQIRPKRALCNSTIFGLARYKSFNN